MSYTILNRGTIIDLIDVVNEYIKDGWLPLGEVTKTIIGYCQAMIKQ